VTAKMTTTFDQERFQRWLSNVLKTSKRAASVVAQEQFRGVIKEAFRLTPPMADSSFANGFSRSRKQIKKDTSTAFISVSEDRGVAALKRRGILLPSGGVSAALRWYKAHQAKNKRVYVGQKRLILRNELERLRQMLIQNIGITAAGWVKAAQELSVRPAAPAWISKHTGKNPGQFKFNASTNELFILALNTSKHSASSYIQKLLDRAFEKQAQKMRRRVISALAAGRVDPNAIDWGKRI
jgi:hypothetical protein